MRSRRSVLNSTGNTTSVGCETRLSGRHACLGVTERGDGIGYEGLLNGGYGSSVCRAQRVRARSARPSASTDVSDASLCSAQCESGLVEHEGTPTRLVLRERKIFFLRIISPRVSLRERGIRERGILFLRILVLV